MEKKLDRTLGLYSAITISVGTMIGSAIFVLAGTSFQSAGPSSSLAVLLAGLAAFPTAFSFAELVTIVPRAGGGYAYARDATNNGVAAFITGWGFWLAYAMSCGLFAIGFGNFLNYFFPFIPIMIGAYSLIFYVMVTNIKGIENTGALQDRITTGLIILLAVYMIYGSFFVDLSYQKPFFPEGLRGTFTAMGFLYITYIGYGLVTTASEEVINPEKIIPKAIIISLIIATFIKTAVFFIGNSIIRWQELIPNVTTTPLTDTAVMMAGRMGGYLFALAGILATVSSINTAMMASSRTSFAMSRDGHLPAVFRHISSKTRTPIASILAATFIVLISTTMRNLEHIATVTSLFALTGYSFVNVALILFRKKMPDAKRAFRVPLYPFMPIAGIAVNIFLVIQLMISNIAALSIAAGISLVGIAYYYIVLPKLKLAPKAVSPEPVPAVQLSAEQLVKKYKVLVPLASPLTAESLIDIGMKIACSQEGVVQPVHIIKVPEVIPLASSYNIANIGGYGYQKIVEHIEKISCKSGEVREPLLVLTRNFFKSLINTVIKTGADLVILGWHPSGIAYRMQGGVVQRALEELPVEVGIFKKGNNTEINKILYPYGGGLHSQETMQIIKRISIASKASITFMHIVDPPTPEEEIEKIRNIMNEGLAKMAIEGDVRIIKSASMEKAVLKESKNHDLLVLGASSSWGIKGHITGGKTDRIMEKITCSGLVIRKFTRLSGKRNIRSLLNRIKKILTD